jgi:predicted AlkP superfamily phosphohydrolase/phosphomutase
MKILIVGLDGADWNIVEPLVATGVLPNLAKIMEGTWGRLESTIPPVTAPSWTSFMTGKNPGKHALYHFIEPRPGSYGVRYTNARSRKAQTVWSMLSDAGKRVGVVNVPMTFPPEPVNGFMVSGMDTPDETAEFIHPKHLMDELRRQVGPIRLNTRYLGFMHTDARRQQVLDELEATDEQRLQMSCYLLDHEPVDVFMVVYGSPDTVQHYFWHYADPGHHRYDPTGAKTFGSAIEDVYRRLDRHIGTLMSRLDADGQVILVSDHGFGPTSSKIFYVNRYLAELGLLTYRRAPALGVGGLVNSAVQRLDRLVRGSLSSEQKTRLARLFPSLRLKWEDSLTGIDAVDWSATRAYATEVLTFPSSISVNLKGREPQGTVEPGREYREVIDFLTHRLLALKDPTTGRPLMRRVLRREEVYHGPHVESAPDLLLAWWEGDGFAGGRTRGRAMPGAPAVEEATGEQSTRAEWSGTHRINGIVAVRGAGVRAGRRLESASITDIAPTLLHLMGQSVPDDMDGRVLTDVFDDEFARRNPVTYRDSGGVSANGQHHETYSDEESEMVQKRLQDLGYVE